MAPPPTLPKMNTKPVRGHSGRPPIADEKKRKKVGFSLPPDVTEAVREISANRKVSFSKVVEDALMKAIAEYYLKRE